MYFEPQSLEGSQGKKSIQATTLMQEIMRRPWRSVAFWLAPYDLLSLSFYKTQGYQSRYDPTHKGMGHPTSITLLMEYLCLLMTGGRGATIEVYTDPNAENKVPIPCWYIYNLTPTSKHQRTSQKREGKTKRARGSEPGTCY